ncbi:MAG: hypothetical protein NZM37_06530 [Sandaracinaceae bacterium]|nr:hypothetical protein [Sandaracinaceae bacterium]MDW8246459.1 hypothetical protein [Sandaracinaceae bacterium]
MHTKEHHEETHHPPQSQRDGLRELSEKEREALRACTMCGACDLQLRADDPWDRATFGPPSRWVLSLANAEIEWEKAAVAIAYVGVDCAARMEQSCHAGIPFVALREAAHQGRPRPKPRHATKEDPG